ncbi:methyl-accepting chemotaxis protein [Campylobacter sp. MIT 12-5580]|uniref:methyl-accepting chemotaxis protein n=1 Tax=Campylobacter sp. MIT 12-5580 TaxID=2040651 RepID=UPI0010F52518|nr:methyl-accepting chemotaxis protein [Campylobacter sp. MIT 12-5580]TKX29406.1 methyl-accepting chemotaxis protein [Campylobacter sp. MIT 12-5580]
MFKNIGFKISAVTFIVLLVSFIIVQVILYLDFKNTFSKMSRENLDTISTSVFQTLKMAMNLGDSQKIEEAIHEAKSMEGVSDVSIYPSKETIELFEMKNPQISSDTLILEQFKNPKLLSLEQEIQGLNYLRLIRPLIADESCVACHANAKLGEVIGVMDVYHSLEGVERDLQQTSKNYMVIFTLALIVTVAVVLFMLKLVVGKPVLELLNHARELAQGSGNLKARIKIKGKDEISRACTYINEFIEKIHKAVQSTNQSSKNVEYQSTRLNENAINLTQITKESHEKIDESFKLSTQVGQDLNELANLSTEANNANDKSYKVLDQMLSSLFDIASKVTQVTQNETQLSQKVSNMVGQANNIKEAIQMMSEVADKTNLLSLNAGIEAARAGGYGRGFSVIAEDIRNLAQSSEEFLDKISAIIKELLESIAQVSAELKENGVFIASLDENTRALTQDAKEVKSCNEESKNLVFECVERIKKSQNNIEILLSSVKENVIISNKNESISQALLQVADELKVVCKSLEEELSHFQI